MTERGSIDIGGNMNSLNNMPTLTDLSVKAILRPVVRGQPQRLRNRPPHHRHRKPNIICELFSVSSSSPFCQPFAVPRLTRTDT